MCQALEIKKMNQKSVLGTSLAIQGTWVLSLVWEDPTCCRAAGPRCAATIEARAPRAHALQQEDPPLRSLATATKSSS